MSDELIEMMRERHGGVVDAALLERIELARRLFCGREVLISGGAGRVYEIPRSRMEEVESGLQTGIIPRNARAAEEALRAGARVTDLSKKVDRGVVVDIIPTYGGGVDFVMRSGSRFGMRLDEVTPEYCRGEVRALAHFTRTVRLAEPEGAS